MVTAKRDADLGNAVLPQLVLAELMGSGELERHLRFLRKRHVRRRDAMIDAVGAHLPAGPRARRRGRPAPDPHLRARCPAGTRPRPTSDLAAAALARGVKTQPLSWHRQRPGPPGLVLGYAASTPAEIHDGIAVIGGILRR